MRKTHQLTHPRHKPAQAVDRVKNTLRKYLKRERRKALPDDADYWDFDCCIGADEATTEVVDVGALIKKVGQLAEEGAPSVYVEILAKPGYRSTSASATTD